MTPRWWARQLIQLWWALRAVCWLCRVPILLRRRPLPVLLARLTPAPRRRLGRHSLALDDAVRLVGWLCRQRCFRGPLFPLACLRHALTLAYVLPRLGYAVELHFGIRKERDALYGHSWVTVQGHPVAEARRIAAFHVVYSYPVSSHPAGGQTTHPVCESAWSAPAARGGSPLHDQDKETRMATDPVESHDPEQNAPPDATTQDKRPWQEPKLTFVEPKLTRHGEVQHVTAGFFGTFVP